MFELVARLVDARHIKEAETLVTEAVSKHDAAGGSRAGRTLSARISLFTPALAKSVQMTSGNAWTERAASDTDVLVASAAKNPTVAVTQEMAQQRESDKWTDNEITAEKRRLRRLFRQEYHALSVLSSFRVLNATAVSKITKKHDKNSTEWKSLRPLAEALVQASNIGSGGFEKYLLDRYEHAYVSILKPDDQDKSVALMRLRKQPSAVKLESNSCLFGFFTGYSAAVTVALVLMVLSEGESFWRSQSTRHCFPMFKSLLLLSAYLWLWSIDLAVFQRKRFNHIFIFEIDPGTVCVFLLDSNYDMYFLICRF